MEARSTPYVTYIYQDAKIGIVYMQGLVYAYICSRSSIFLEFFKCFIK